jgi:predicted TIM-barrel fold metal-dependent hydrolase
MSMPEPLARAHALSDAYREWLLSELPAGLELFDAHTHLGQDIDGMVGNREELLASKGRHRISRSFVFCLDEPDREPAFRAANDRSLEHAAAADGALLPFVRLDLDREPLEEADRALSLGARGIKLHPRAQRFPADDPRLEPVFELAADRQVPILIHGGRGLPPIAHALSRLVERHGPTLIVAHAGVADMEALADRFAGQPGVFFDTSVGHAVDQLALLRLVPPEQIVFASDYPYGSHLTALVMALSTCRFCGLGDDEVGAVLGGNAARVADSSAPLPPSQPRGHEELSVPLTLARVGHYLSMTAALLWLRSPEDSLGMLGLAINACREAPRQYAETTDRMRELLEAARDVWSLAATADEAERARLIPTARQLLQLASTLAATHA